MSEPHILMCPPDHFGIHYEINLWMSRNRPCDVAQAARQWSQLRSILESLGAKISTLSPVEGLPDLVFTARIDAALIYRKRAILSNFLHSERQGEEPHFASCLAAHGFEIETLAEEETFEGAGDALFCGDTLLAGYRMRSHARAHHRIAQLLGVRVLPLELVDGYYYHLDTCFCPLAPGVAIYYPGAFDSYGRAALAEAVDELIPGQRNRSPTICLQRRRRWPPGGHQYGLSRATS